MLRNVGADAVDPGHVDFGVFAHHSLQQKVQFFRSLKLTQRLLVFVRLEVAVLAHEVDGLGVFLGVPPLLRVLLGLLGSPEVPQTAMLAGVVVPALLGRRVDVPRVRRWFGVSGAAVESLAGGLPGGLNELVEMIDGDVAVLDVAADIL